MVLITRSTVYIVEPMICEEKARLVEEYSAATLAFSRSVHELRLIFQRLHSGHGFVATPRRPYCSAILRQYLFRYLKFKSSRIRMAAGCEATARETPIEFRLGKGFQEPSADALGVTQ